MAYENRCGSCYWLRDMRSDSRLYDTGCYERGHCIELKTCPYPDETTCSNYKDRETYSNYNYPASKQTSTGCFITTIVCSLMEEKDKCSILETLRDFRKNVMQKDSKYKELLFEYDTVGPQIAKNLEDDQEYELANGILNFYIIPAVYLIREKKYEEAVKKYTTMTKALEDYYGISVDTKVPENYDYKNGGHGKMLIRRGF